jgi:chromosome segregation ATPase
MGNSAHRKGSPSLATAVGRLEGQISELKEQLKSDRSETRRERENASQHRKDLREVIGALSGAVQELTRQVAEAKPLWTDYQARRATMDGMEKRLEGAVAVLDEFKENRAEMRGAAKLLKFIYIAIAAVAGFASSIVANWMNLGRGH